jgi:N-acetylglucosamine-6-sulfatase
MKYFFVLLPIFIALALIPACAKGTDSGGSGHSAGDDSVGDDSADDTSVQDDTGDDDHWPEKPNLVVIMADDLDSPTLQKLLDDGMMPNLRECIIDKAWTFSESFVTNPLCCPSRATFLTGQYSHNNGVLNNELPIGGASMLDDSSTLAVWLHEKGYQTGIVGKYLNGYGEDTSQTYVPPGWDDWEVLIDPTTYQVYEYMINDNGNVAEYGDSADDYQTDVLAKRAVQMIKHFDEDEANPFFLWVTPLAPHPEFPEGWFTDFHGMTDWYTLTIRPAPRHENIYDIDLPDVPNFNEADVSDKPYWIKIRPSMSDTDIQNARSQYNDRLAAMLAEDDLIGSVCTTLYETGRLDNTVLIFTSDNGFLLGKHRVPQKTADYEESIRVPLYIRIPGMSPGASENIVLNNDLAPTLAAFADAVPGIDVDGRSFIPLFSNPDTTDWRKRFFIQHWAYTTISFEVPTYNAIRTGPSASEAPNMLYVEYLNGENISASELYDIPADPYQLQSLHEDSSEQRVAQRTALSAQVQQFLACSGESCRELEDASVDR